jgi:2-keto-4-pentenoate hydratase/2-oxohepta-3-ene-1,7-dioic acid hydratase in catechol pathway
MKIVSFESPAGLRLGVVEGDQVVDLQAADAKVPNELGALLASTNGDLSSVNDLAKRAPAVARRPLAGIKYALPVGRPGKIICLGLNTCEIEIEGVGTLRNPIEDEK